MNRSRIIFFGLGLLVFQTHTLWAAANSVRVWEEGAYRFVQSNGIPDHAPGEFPNPGNPNTIAPQNYTFRMPRSPRPSGRMSANDHDFLGWR